MSSSYESDKSEEIRMLQIKNQELQDELNKLKAIPCDKCHIMENKYQAILAKFKELSKYFPKIVQFIQKHIQDNPNRQCSKSSSVLYDAINVKKDQSEIAKQTKIDQQDNDINKIIEQDIIEGEKLKQENEKLAQEECNEREEQQQSLEKLNIKQKAQQISEKLSNEIGNLQEIGQLKDQLITLQQRVGGQMLEIQRTQQLVEQLTVTKTILTEELNDINDKQSEKYQQDINLEIKYKAAQARAEYFEQLLSKENATQTQLTNEFLNKIAKLTNENIILSAKLKSAQQELALLKNDKNSQQTLKQPTD